MALLEVNEDLLKLKEAAENGDVKFLKNCVASNKSDDYYLTVFQRSSNRQGNIFHLAAWYNREDFIREVIESLPRQVLKQLLNTCMEDGINALHVAAGNGNVEIVKLFLNLSAESTESTKLESLQKPWLQKDYLGRTPCYLAIVNGFEESGLEILKKDLEVLSNITTNQGRSILFESLSKGLTKIAFEILRFSPSFSSSGYSGANALDVIIHCQEQEGEDICRLLLERDPKVIEPNVEGGYLRLQAWAVCGKLWAFKCLLKCNDIIPNIRSALVTLLSQVHYETGGNLLHNLACTNSTNEEDIVEIAKLFIDSYKLENETQSFNISEDLFPWYTEANERHTPLIISIFNGHDKLSMYIISEDNNAIINSYYNPLFAAIDKGRNAVGEMILDIIDKQGWIHLLTLSNQQNALHVAPKCSAKLCKRLFEKYPWLLKGVDKQGYTIAHMWAEIGEIWPFKFVIQSGEIDEASRIKFIKLTSVWDYNMNTPIHVAANSTQEEQDTIAKLLIEAFKRLFPSHSHSHARRRAQLPWFFSNKSGDAPLHIAIRNKRQNFALYILSLRNHNEPINVVLDLYQPLHNVLFLAMENHCYQVAKEIVSKLDKQSWTEYLMDSTDARNVLHLLPTTTDTNFGIWLIENLSEFISKPNHSGNTPLDEASRVGVTWIIKAMLEKESSTFTNAPLAWITACKNGQVKATSAFIDYNPGMFKHNCIEHNDSPWHHIRLSSMVDYEEFANLQRIKELINLQDVQGATPLHIAIRNEDIFLTETLLCMEKIAYDISDVKNETAIDLLAQICIQNKKWDMMCKRIGFDPSIKTTFFQRRTNLLDVRNTISVVAALLATITFTAGFTLPGGFDQTGESIIAKKTAFLVFLISDTLALFFSILVLVCLIWSMVYDPSKSLLLIDRSMVLLMRALYFTLLAFMTGVYVVISPKSLWAAILVLGIVCTLICISVSKTLLYKVINKFIPATSKDYINTIRQLELGEVSPCFRGNSSLQEDVPLTSENHITEGDQ